MLHKTRTAPSEQLQSRGQPRSSGLFEHPEFQRSSEPWLILWKPRQVPAQEELLCAHPHLQSLAFHQGSSAFAETLPRQSRRQAEGGRKAPSPDLQLPTSNLSLTSKKYFSHTAGVPNRTGSDHRLAAHQLTQSRVQGTGKVTKFATKNVCWIIHSLRSQKFVRLCALLREKEMRREWPLKMCF